MLQSKRRGTGFLPLTRDHCFISVPRLVIGIIPSLRSGIIATKTNVKRIGECNVGSTSICLGPASHLYKIADPCYGPRRVFLDDGFVDPVSSVSP